MSATLPSRAAMSSIRLGRGSVERAQFIRQRAVQDLFDPFERLSHQHPIHQSVIVSQCDPALPPGIEGAVTQYSGLERWRAVDLDPLLAKLERKNVPTDRARQAPHSCMLHHQRKRRRGFGTALSHRNF